MGTAGFSRYHGRRTSDPLRGKLGQEMQIQIGVYRVRTLPEHLISKALLRCLAFLVLPAVLALCSMNSATAQDMSLLRMATDNVVSSSLDPAGIISLPNGTRHIGASRWPLFDSADCEVHVFVQADAAKNVERLYWIQFEAYLPSKPDARYGYSGQTTELGGRSFFVRTRYGRGDEEGKPGSDWERVRQIVLQNGYRLPDELLNVRLVNLLDAERRKELMIIYAENLGSYGATVNGLLSGQEQDLWASIEQRVLEKAKQAISVRFD